MVKILRRAAVSVLLPILALIVLAGHTDAQEAQSTTATLRGVVSTQNTNGQALNIPAATLKLTGAGQTQQTSTTDQGEFEFTNLLPGEYALEISALGFKTTNKTITIHRGENSFDNLSLEVADVSALVTVAPDDQGVQTTDAAPATTVSQNTLETLPLPKEQLIDAMPMVPGVLRGPDGQIDVKGARSSQSAMTVNSTNVTDPVTGEFAINLPIEAVESVQVLTNPYSAEYGKFTGGVMAVETKSGTDKFNVDAQSFFPRFRRRGEKWAGIEAFTPRLSFSGPVRKNKVWFMQSFEYRFLRTPIESLPPFRQDTGLETFDSVTQLDYDINPRNHLTGTFSLFPQKLTFVGLNTFNPQEVTPNFKQRGFFWAVNERRTTDNNAVLESYLSLKKFDADIFPSSGEQPMNFAPSVNSGNFFNRQDRDSKRLESLEIYSFTPPDFAGTHFMKVGVGLSHTTFDGSNTSNRVRILRRDGTVSEQIDFLGSGVLDRRTTEISSFFEDKWTIADRLTLEYGVRLDRDNISETNNFAPRLAFAFTPIRGSRTVIRGGVGLFYNEIDLNVATFPQLQERSITRFGLDGVQLLGPSQLQRLVLQDGRFLTPRSVNLNIELDREWVKNLLVKVGYLQRNGTREYLLDPIESTTLGNELILSNNGESRYRELQVAAHYTLHGHDEINASYVRSRATGDLNDFNSYFSNFENPIIRANERSLLPFDAPNRLIFWGELPTIHGIIVSPVFDIRNGFPLSVIDETRSFVGPRNRAGRFPAFYSLDLQVMKTVNIPGKWEKYRARVGFKVFNATNHFNPRDFQANLASADFGGFYNGVGRKFGIKFSVEKK